MPRERRYLAFDLETIRDIPGGEDWQDHRPLGIGCAAVCSEEHGRISFCSAGPNGEIADVMKPEDLRLMVRMLESAQRDRGFTIVTWNGLGFDLDVLAEESGLQPACRGLALEHVDLMFHVLCKRGHTLSLNAAALGMGLEGKPEGMDEPKAVRMWADHEREDVLEYCMQDAACTLEVALAGEKAGTLRWTARSGRSQSMAIRAGWLNVQQALRLPLPGAEWMDDPVTRESHTEWLNREGGEPPKHGGPREPPG